MAVPAHATLNEAMIDLTDKGAEKVREFLAAQSEQNAFDEERDGDTVIESHGIRLLVDAASAPYVRGATVDFVDGLQGAGFKVDNPNVVAACGCGSSFRVAEEEEVSAV